MITTMISGSRVSKQFLTFQEQIDVKVLDYRTVKESILKSTTLYRIETKSNLLNLYEYNKVYVVERRFNDFK